MKLLGELFINLGKKYYILNKQADYIANNFLFQIEKKVNVRMIKI